MTIPIDQTIHHFVSRAIQDGWLDPLDYDYTVNQLLARLALDGLDSCEQVLDPELTLLDYLDQLEAYALEQGLIADSAFGREAFEAAIMDLLTPLPSVLNQRFWALYQESPERATDYFYALSRANDYIKTRHIAKNIAFSAASDYGDLQITINLSKPEKDPKDIAAAKLAKPSHYPKCLLCMQNEGYRGRTNHPARQNHRLIRLSLGGGNYGMQYSPYVYYNEHSIFLNQKHVPMKVDRACFEHLLDIIEVLPHYFAGSNADLPIVGGSILSHDHYQGGRHTFPMDQAPAYDTANLTAFPDLSVELVKWPLSVIRLRSQDKAPLVDAATALLDFWRAYSDESCDILAFSGETPHNTITPIARRRNGAYELDLVLRNNRTTKTYPDGLFHPHPDVQHIKKENIGLIEVMGLAILPPRLVGELATIKDFLLGQASLDQVADYHQSWAQELATRHPDVTADQVDRLLQTAVGAKFARVLEDAGVYKQTSEGRAGLRRFLDAFNQA